MAESEMIERVARALCQRNCGHIGGPDAESLVPGKKNWVFHTDDARAGFAALEEAGYVIVPREPTEAMVDAARDPRVANGSPISKGAHEVWRAMIGAATS